jgi:hypothetical protein
MSALKDALSQWETLPADVPKLEAALAIALQAAQEASAFRGTDADPELTHNQSESIELGAEGVQIDVVGDEGPCAIDAAQSAALGTQASSRKKALLDERAELGIVAMLGPFKPRNDEDIATRTSDLLGMGLVTRTQMALTVSNTMVRVLLVSLTFAGVMGGSITMIKRITLRGDLAFSYPRAVYTTMTMYVTRRSFVN